MKKQELRKDVESLIEQTVMEEVVVQVWNKFQESLEHLDEEAIVLLRKHFEGKPVKELARAHGLTEAELETWLQQIKRDVLQGLRKKSTVRQ